MLMNLLTCNKNGSSLAEGCLRLNTFIISKEWLLLTDDVKKMNKAVKEAKAGGVHVVKEEFVEAARKGGAALLITSHSICDWGTDVCTVVHNLYSICTQSIQ